MKLTTVCVAFFWCVPYVDMNAWSVDMIHMHYFPKHFWSGLTVNTYRLWVSTFCSIAKSENHPGDFFVLNSYMQVQSHISYLPLCWMCIHSAMYISQYCNTVVWEYFTFQDFPVWIFRVEQFSYKWTYSTKNWAIACEGKRRYKGPLGSERPFLGFKQFRIDIACHLFATSRYLASCEHTCYYRTVNFPFLDYSL